MPIPPTRPSGRGGLTLGCRLLPPAVRDDVFALYGVLRRVDDLVDDGAPEARRRVTELERWAIDGSLGSPEAEALERLGRRHPLSREAVVEFCRGMEHDLDGRRLRTEVEVDRYCRRVAGTVGVLVTDILGAHRPATQAATTLGIALQRTNILRDVDEDAARGRCYVAEETLARFGPAEPGRREALVRDQIARADHLYDEGLAGLGSLRRGRWAVAAAAGAYREILRQIERDGHGAVAGRAVVPLPRRTAVALRAAVAMGPRTRTDPAGAATVPGGRATSSSAPERPRSGVPRRVPG